MRNLILYKGVVRKAFFTHRSLAQFVNLSFNEWYKNEYHRIPLQDELGNGFPSLVTEPVAVPKIEELEFNDRQTTINFVIRKWKISRGHSTMYFTT